MDKDTEYEFCDIAMCGHVNDMYIIIHTDDVCNIPHFHIYNNQYPNKSTINVCLKIESSEYINHDRQEGTLSNEQIKQITSFLYNERIRDKLSYWQHLVNTWNSNNYNYEIPYNTKMPNYMSLIKTL